MGYGDEILATGLAKGLYDQGKQAAFGDGQKIIWSEQAKIIFKNNPNIAQPGEEGKSNLIWFKTYPGVRPYIKQDLGDRWEWNYDHKIIPGEFFYDQEELNFIRNVYDIGEFSKNRRKNILIEPHTKDMAPNKKWPFDRYQKVVDILIDLGYKVYQFDYGKEKLNYVYQIPTKNFREVILYMNLVDFYIGAEGGLHHTAAALNKKAVVLFGGFIDPKITGYGKYFFHKNIFTGNIACGVKYSCYHCMQAMDNITVDMVIENFKQIW